MTKKKIRLYLLYDDKILILNSYKIDLQYKVDLQ